MALNSINSVLDMAMTYVLSTFYSTPILDLTISYDLDASNKKIMPHKSLPSLRGCHLFLLFDSTLFAVLRPVHVCEGRTTLNLNEDCLHILFDLHHG